MFVGSCMKVRILSALLIIKDLGGENKEFEKFMRYLKCGGVVQRLGQGTVDAQIAGSSPVTLAKSTIFAEVMRDTNGKKD